MLATPAPGPHFLRTQQFAADSAGWPRICSVSSVEMSTRRLTGRGWFARAQLVCALAAVPSSCGRKAAIEEEARIPAESPPANVPVREVETWKSAALKVEEDRHEPMGLAAKVDVPIELRHYENRHRFLAIQVAESREQDLPLPHDYPE